MATYQIKTDGTLTKNGANVAQIVDLNGDGTFTAIGAFGEVYGKGSTRKEAAQSAAKDPRIGKVPAGAAK